MDECNAGGACCDRDHCLRGRVPQQQVKQSCSRSISGVAMRWDIVLVTLAAVRPWWPGREEWWWRSIRMYCYEASYIAYKHDLLSSYMLHYTSIQQLTKREVKSFHYFPIFCVYISWKSKSNKTITHRLMSRQWSLIYYLLTEIKVFRKVISIRYVHSVPFDLYPHLAETGRRH
jgi:hypothetical protein